MIIIGWASRIIDPEIAHPSCTYSFILIFPFIYLYFFFFQFFDPLLSNYFIPDVFSLYIIINLVINIRVMHPNIQIASIPLQINHTASQIKYNKITKNTYDRDVIPGLYEGGYKVWQCTIDLLKYITNTHHNIHFNQLTVIDIGCGHGLLGITALKLGAASCYFQDYNKEVLDSTTKQNIMINDLSLKNCLFIDGDWDNIKEFQSKVDIILGAELIYRAQNYDKIIRLCQRMLKPDTGRAILANKHYYFGLDGNMDDFKQRIQANGLCYESLLKISPPKGGNKKQIISLFIKNQMKQ